MMFARSAIAMLRVSAGTACPAPAPNRASKRGPLKEVSPMNIDDIELGLTPALDPQEDKTTPWCIGVGVFCLVYFGAHYLIGAVS